VSDPDYLDRLVDDDALGAYLTAEFGSADTFAVERHAEASRHFDLHHRQ
jgi:hypothetical protein